MVVYVLLAVGVLAGQPPNGALEVYPTMKACKETVIEYEKNIKTNIEAGMPVVAYKLDCKEVKLDVVKQGKNT